MPRVVASTVTPFVLAGLGLSVRAGAPKPDVSTVESYAAALLAAESIGYSRGCSGTHVAEGIAELGLTQELTSKTTRTEGGPVTDFLARADFEIGRDASRAGGIARRGRTPPLRQQGRGCAASSCSRLSKRRG